MSHIDINSNEDDVKSSSSYIEEAVEENFDDHSGIFEGGDLLDVSRGDIDIVASVNCEWKDYDIEVMDSDKIDITLETGRATTPRSEPCVFSTRQGCPKESFSLRSHPIPLNMLTDNEVLSQMRVLAGKPPEEMEVSISEDPASDPGAVTDDTCVRRFRGVSWPTKELVRLKKTTKAFDTMSADDVKNTDKFFLCLETITTQRSNECNSSPIANFHRKSRISPKNKGLSIMSAEQKTETILPDRSVSLGDVRIGGNNEENQDPWEEGYEISSGIQKNGCRTLSTESKKLNLRPSTMSITRGGDRAEKNKLTDSVLRKFDLLQVTDTEFLSPDENKKTPKDEYAQSIAEISEQLVHFWPEKSWQETSGKQFGRRSHQGERSLTGSVSSAAPNMNLANIFESVLVNEISKEHSYLKPSNRKGVHRNWRAYNLPKRYEKSPHQPFESRETRYDHHEEALEPKRLLEKDYPPKNNGWFSSIFSNVSLSPFI